MNTPVNEKVYSLNRLKTLIEQTRVAVNRASIDFVKKYSQPYLRGLLKIYLSQVNDMKLIVIKIAASTVYLNSF